MKGFDSAEAFIFDCDGTLLDTLAAWDNAERDLFLAAGGLTREQEDEIHSSPIDLAAKIFHERYGVGASSEAVLAHLDGYLVDFYTTKARALPGARDFVKKVANAGVPCVVLSSSPRRYLEPGLARAGMLDCFEAIVTTDEVGCSKQEAQIYERALEILGSKRSVTWAVDDAPYAIAVMRDFGLNTIAVGNGCAEERRFLLESSATRFVQSLEELL